VDGANAWQSFLNVTLPGLRPVLSFVTMVTILASANMFGQSYLMTQGQPGTETRTLIYQIAETGLRNFQMGDAAAMSYVMTIMLVFLSIVVFWLFRDAPRSEEAELMATSVEPTHGASRSGARSATAGKARGPGTRSPARKVVRYVVLVLLGLLFISPLIFMVSTSFKTRQDATAIPPSWIPPNPTTDAYTAILNAAGTPVLRWFANSLIAAACNALLVVATASLAAYALARMEFRVKRVVFALIVATLFVPPVILTIPNYLIVGQLRWLDTLVAVIVPTAASAFGVFFLRQFFLSLPRELEEAAFLDGANRWQIFYRVILPLSRPALVTLGLLAFLTNWNDFLWPVYVLFSPESQTLPAGLSTLQSANSVRYDLLMAGAVIASVPALLLFMFSQRFVIEGVSRSGIKG
jgi:multiple sugar transport system permease protein